MNHRITLTGFALFVGLFVFSGCSTTGTEEAETLTSESHESIDSAQTQTSESPESIDSAQIQLEISSAELLCMDELFYIALTGTNLGAQSVSLDSDDSVGDYLPLEVSLRRTDTRGGLSGDSPLVDGEIAPGDSARILVMFGELNFIGPPLNLLDVHVEGETVFEKEISVSDNFCS